MKELPTDREILRDIFVAYVRDYPGPLLETGKGVNDPYIPIDVNQIAARLKCSRELLFGRLYYYLAHRHGYEQSDGSRVDLFALMVGGQRHVVNFPYLASVLADYEATHYKETWTLRLSAFSLAVSIVAIVISLIKI